jgi:outer membrane protein assembly factor BamB
VEIDLNTGKKGWTKKIEDGALFDSALSVELSISKNTLIVGRSESGVGLSLSDGEQIWSKTEEKDGVCFPSGFTGGDRVIAVLSCAAGQANEHERVEELDAATGKTKWTKELPKGWKLERVYSTSPVVLYMTNEDKKQWNISTLKDGSSATRSQVDVNESFAPECGWAVIDRDLQGCTGTAADGNTLYLPTEAKSGANEIVAVNLSTGKESWRAKAPGDTSMLPLRVEGGAVIAYQEPSYDKGGAVLSIPTAGTHKPKTLLQDPQSTAEIENGFYSKAVDYVAGRLYISTTRLNGNDQTQEKLMMAFGN